MRAATASPGRLKEGRVGGLADLCGGAAEGGKETDDGRGLEVRFVATDVVTVDTVRL
jgi:hypothetical protein